MTITRKKIIEMLDSKSQEVVGMFNARLAAIQDEANAVIAEFNTKSAELVAMAEQARVQMLEELQQIDRMRIYENGVVEEVIDHLRNVAKVATMDRANFYRPHEPLENDPTPMIRERTLLWRQSWIIDPVETIIEVLRSGSLYDEEHNRRL